MNNESILNGFESFMIEEGKTKNTIKNYMADIKKILSNTPPRGEGVFLPTQKAYSEYAQQIKKSGLKPATINRRLMSLRLLFRYLMETGQCEKFPLDNQSSKAINVQTTALDTRWLEKHQVRELFAAIDKLYDGNIRLKVRAMFSLMVNSGLRISEVCDLKRTDVDFERGLLHVFGKGGKYRIVPFNTAVRRNLLAWYACEPAKGEYVFHSNRNDKMSVRGAQHFAESIQEQVKFEFTIHGLRHTALKALADATGSIEIVASVAGHSNINTTKRYIQPSITEIQDAMKETEFDF